MSDPDPNSIEAPGELLQIVEELTDLLLDGRWDSVENLISNHAEFAEELESVLPALCMMHNVGVPEGTNQGLRAMLAIDDPHLSLKGRLGDFQIGREIGRGGMGVVYEAEQLLLGRRVALKVLPFAAMLDERNRTRFQNEARAAATLHHPNIVPVYAVGIERGIHYYAMQYVDGQSLSELLTAMRNAEDEEGPSESGEAHRSDQETVVARQAEISTERTSDRQDFFRSVAKLGIQIADALHHAHERGVIHRDIKPANIMLDEFGSARITDFGLARLDGDSNLTLSGDIVGTLRYSPPEQVLGQQSVVDERVDVYSLGATLFEMLSLRPVMAGQNRETLLQQVTFGQSPRLRGIDATIPIDLETIVHRSIERDADDRYPSASLMADDLRRFVESKPLLSQRPGLIRRTNRWAKRHPTALLSAAIVLFLALLGTSLAYFAINQERSRTVAQRDEAISNLLLSLDTVNEMHNEVAMSWIASDRDLSDTQIDFLSRSSRFFAQIARRFEGDAKFRDVAGLAFIRSAQTNSRLMEFPKAESEFKKGQRLLEQAIEVDPGNKDLLRDLASGVESLGSMYLTMGKLEPARKALSAAEEQLKQLLDKSPNEIRYRLPLLSIAYKRAQLAWLDLDDDEAIRLGRGMGDELGELPNEFDSIRGKSEYALLSAYVESRSLRRLGRVEEASEVCRQALKTTAVHLTDWQDDRGIVRLIAQLEAGLGLCHLASGEQGEAEGKFRAALARIRRSFIFDGTPKEFSFAYMAKKATTNQMEPEAFRQYCEIQAALGDTLRLQGKHDESFVQLDESVRSLHALTALFPANPEYAVEAASSATILARGAQTDEKRREVILGLLAKTSKTLEHQVGRSDVPVGRIATYAALLSAQGEALTEAGRLDEANHMYEDAIKAQQRVIDRRPDLLLARERSTISTTD